MVGHVRCSAAVNLESRLADSQGIHAPANRLERLRHRRLFKISEDGALKGERVIVLSFHHGPANGVLPAIGRIEVLTDILFLGCVDPRNLDAVAGDSLAAGEGEVLGF